MNGSRSGSRASISGSIDDGSAEVAAESGGGAATAPVQRRSRGSAASVALVVALSMTNLERVIKLLAHIRVVPKPTTLCGVRHGDAGSLRTAPTLPPCGLPLSHATVTR